MSFNYTDYFDVNISDPLKRQEVISALNWLGSLKDGEGVQLIEKAMDSTGGKIKVVPAEGRGSNAQEKKVQLSFMELETLAYLSSDGKEHPMSLKRILVHEIFHLTQDIDEYLEKVAPKWGEIFSEGMERYQNSMPEEEKLLWKAKTRGSLSNEEQKALEEKFGTNEADIANKFASRAAVKPLIEAMFNVLIKIKGKGEEHLYHSDEFKSYTNSFEGPAVEFANRLMEKYEHEPHRASYEHASFSEGRMNAIRPAA